MIGTTGFLPDVPIIRPRPRKVNSPGKSFIICLQNCKNWRISFIKCSKFFQNQPLYCHPAGSVVPMMAPLA